jgi:hypothetical protein
MKLCISSDDSEIKRFSNRTISPIPVKYAASTEIAPPSEVDSVKTRLLNLLYGDQATCQRYVEAERRRNPHQSEQQLCQAAIDRLEHDRR